MGNIEIILFQETGKYSTGTIGLPWPPFDKENVFRTSVYT